MTSSIFTRLAARYLSRLGADKRHRHIIERTRQIRRELGLPDDRRLA
jgi:hypothetical protein